MITNVNNILHNSNIKKTRHSIQRTVSRVIYKYGNWTLGHRDQTRVQANEIGYLKAIYNR